MRKTMILIVCAALLIPLGCSQSPEAQKANEETRKAASDAGQKFEEAAKATGNVVIKGTKAAGKQIQDAADEVDRSANGAPPEKTP